MGTPASAFTLDFETDPNGNILDAAALDAHSSGNRRDVGTIWSSIGINISGSSPRPLGLFQSNCAPLGGTSDDGFTVPCEKDGDGDNDLATGKGSYGTITYDTNIPGVPQSGPQGNVLIFEENPGNGVPDDTSSGGTMTFNFDRALLSSVKIEKIGIIDDAKGSILIRYLNSDGSITESDPIQIVNTEENELQFFPGIADRQVHSFDVAFDGSGAVSGVVFSEFKAVPTPALLPGLIGMGVAAIRKRKGEQEATSET